jgi:hypothetical protein
MARLPSTPDVEFRRWNLYVFLSALVIIAQSRGWPLHVRLPFLEIPPETSIAVINVAWLCLWFFGMKMVAEWSLVENRKQWGILIQLIGGCIVFLAGQLFFIGNIINFPYYIKLLFVPETFFISIIIILGCVTGYYFSLLFELLTFTRSKRERERTGLPRFPVVVTSVARVSGAFSLLAAVAAFGISFTMNPPVSSHWWQVYLGATILTSLPRAISVLLGKKRLGKAKRAIDTHDTMYMTYGGMEGSPEFSPDPLYVAAEQGDEDAVREHVDSGCDPDKVGYLGWTPLMIAVAEGHNNIAKHLLTCGANPNTGNFSGRTPLMFASGYGTVDMVRTLLDYGADPNFTSLPIRPPNNHPLMAGAGIGHKEIVELLIEAGADLNIVDTEGRTAEDYARLSGHGEIATLLRKKRRKDEDR